MAVVSWSFKLDLFFISPQSPWFLILLKPIHLTLIWPSWPLGIQGSVSILRLPLTPPKQSRISQVQNYEEEKEWHSFHLSSHSQDIHYLHKTPRGTQRPVTFQSPAASIIHPYLLKLTLPSLDRLCLLSPWLSLEPTLNSCNTSLRSPCFDSGMVL